MHLQPQNGKNSMSYFFNGVHTCIFAGYHLCGAGTHDSSTLNACIWQITPLLGLFNNNVLYVKLIIKI